jgi:penicillin amidase
MMVHRLPEEPLMKWKRWLKRFALALLALVVVAVAVVYIYLRRTVPDYDGELAVAGIKAPVEILRDSYGMPHVYAASETDAAFGLGYAMAQDRLFQMDMIRRVIRGRMAEVLGAELVPMDKLFRTVTAPMTVDALYARLDPELQQLLVAYTAGVNAFLKTRRSALPLEFTLAGYEPEPWRPADCMASYYLMAWQLTSSFETELLHHLIAAKLGQERAADLYPQYPKGYPAILPEGEATLRFLEAAGLAREVLGPVGDGNSNNWVVAGSKSKTGKPLLANDPHLALPAPGIWYEAHLVTPNANVTGVVIPGAPAVAIGTNGHVAWGYTNTMLDDADYYLERVNPRDPNQVEYLGQWETMKVSNEVIKVKGKPDVVYRLRRTRHGPVIDEVNDFDEPGGHVLAMRWVARERFGAVKALYLFNGARSIDDIERAMEHFKCPGQNVVYADRQGNIGFWTGAGIPRREGFSGAHLLPGWDGKHEWNGYVPTAQQPHLRNPAQGWIASANNKHVADGYPYTISNNYVGPDRYLRIREMLTAKRKLGVDDFVRMQGDTLMPLAREWVPLIGRALQRQALSPVEREAARRLAAWDFRARADAVGPSIFHAVLDEMVRDVLRPRLGERLYARYIKTGFITRNALREIVGQEKRAWLDDPKTPAREGAADLFRRSFRAAVRRLVTWRGEDADNWRWGDLHRLTLYHPIGKKSALLGRLLNIGPVGIGGSYITVNAQGHRVAGAWEVGWGVSTRFIFDLGDLNRSLRVLPAGVSGNFMSPHYDDQFDLWRKVEYRPLVLDRKLVERDVRHTLKLRPGA